MKKKFILLPLVGALLYVILSGYAEGPAYYGGIEGTGATGTAGCSCHNPSSSAATTVQIQLYDATGTTLITGGYVGGTVYKIKISGTQANTLLTHFGFQMAVVKAAGAGTGSAVNAGTMSAAPGGTHVYTLGSLNIFEHYNAGTRAAVAGTLSGGIENYTETITWTAPVAGTGNVLVYGTINAVNFDGVDGPPDTWNNTSLTINEAAPAVSPITGTTTVCAGATTPLSDVTASGTWSSSNTSFATVTSGGLVSGVSAGSAAISYITASGFAVATVTVNPLAVAGTITVTGTSSVCAGSIIHLTDASTGGVWSSSNTSFATVTATGDVHGVAGGSVNISYSVTNGCGTVATSVPITVNPLPVAGTITGPSSVCASSIIHLTDATTGGVWSSTNTSFATVTATGDVSGVAAGSASISYTVTNGCGTIAASVPVTVNANPVAGTITGGAASVCAGSQIALSDASPGGVWSSTNTSFATVSGGIVTGAAAGSATISYTVTNGCGTVAASVPVTVNPVPVPGTITGGASTVCAGSAISFSDAATGGVWSSTNTSFATVTSTGTVNGVAAGSVSISYTVTNGCGTLAASVPVTVNPAPIAGTIIDGAPTVCVGSSIAFSDASPGGVWISNNTSLATVTDGVVTGAATGGVIISYSVTNSCGTVVASVPVTVNPLPVPGTITGGASTVCAGSAISFSDAAAGGVWSSTNTSFATVTSAGTVNGVAAGSVTISYTVTNSCGTLASSAAVTVNPVPVAGTIIGGAPAVCAGSQIAFSDVAGGGVWSSTNTSFATVSGGIVTGVAGGGVTISYTVTNSCGTVAASVPVTVNPSPVAGTITGGAPVCVGAMLPLSDGSAGGVWSSTNTLLGTVTPTGGVVTGVSSGLFTISYTVSNSCGTVVTSVPVFVNPSPVAGTITGGAATVCAGSSITFSDAATGGVWSSDNTSIATVSGGTVHGIAGGSVNISYTVTNSCGSIAASVPLTINPLPVAGTLTGGSSVICTGSATTFSDAATGGVWSSNNTAVATVSTLGVVSGITVGSVIISYSVTNSCGTLRATAPVNVTLVANAGAITGSSGVCPGSSVTLSDGVSGGTWSSTNTNAAVVNSAGQVTGIATGVTTISYTVSGSCGAAATSAVITVSSLPLAGTINGATVVCQGSSINLSDATGSGVWSSSNTSLATVNSGGMVGGVSAGTPVISYTFTNSCGSASATYTVTVNPLPSGGAITGATGVCIGATIPLSDGIAGGVWSSSNTNVATVDAGGGVHGVAAGPATISYTVTNSCGTASVTYSVTTDAPISVGAIAGASAVCVGATLHLSDATTGGVWSSTNTSFATVVPTGAGTAAVSGASAGGVSISYSVTNSCGTVAAGVPVTVNPLPIAGTITGGAATVCAGSAITFSDAAGGGVWSSTNTSFATVTPTGTVNGVAAGSVNISYTVTNGCGTIATDVPVTVNPLPIAGTITGGSPSVCAGSQITFSDASGGGVWSSTNTSFATVTPTGGIVRGVSAGSVSISYAVTNGCGTVTTSVPVTVNPVPVAGTITGAASSVCVGSAIAFSDAATGGVWSSTNTSFATVTPAGSVVGVSAGSVTISYSVTNGCGTIAASIPVTVNPMPGAGTITGPSSVCVGAVAHLSDASPGGVWISDNTSFATVTPAGGAVSGVSGGSVNISYSVTNSCGTAAVSIPVTVNPLAVAGTITGGAPAVCVGSAIAFSDAATGGVWSSSNTTFAIVSSTGDVSGISAGGVTVSYSVTNSCGTVVANVPVTVNPLPFAGTIAGPSSVCVGSAIHLSDAASGGVWSSDNTSLAVVGTGNGIVNGISGGSVTISYSVTNGCGTATASVSVTVNSLPSAGAITGPSSVCTGASVPLSDATGGGVWSSSNTSLATISPTGTVNGISAGSVTITYTIGGSCGASTATAPVTINALPVAGTITGGASTVCAGSFISFSDATGSGVWSSSNASLATVVAGVVGGVSAGTATISYTVTNGCGAAAATATVVVNSLPNTGTITGPDSVCQGSIITLSDAVAGGVWSVSNANAFVSFAGVFISISPGFDTAIYTVTNVCGTAHTSLPVKIRDLTACAGDAVAGVDKEEVDINLYPNPSQGSFTVDMPETPSGATIMIVDVLGKVIETRNIKDIGREKVPFHIAMPGNYIVKISIADIVYRRKVVIW